MKVALLGDLALFGRFSVHDNPGVLGQLESVRDWLRSHDIVVANLETPFFDVERPHGAKSAHIRSASANVEVLQYLGITHVGLANNHIGDYGTKGLRNTLAVLARAGIEAFGVQGRSSRVAANGGRVALSGYCAFNTNPLLVSVSGHQVHALSVDHVIEGMLEHDRAGFLNVLSVHSGQEHVPMPSSVDVRLARALARRFDYVYCGHHPHVIQGFERVSGSHIYYSLGNFLFDDVYTPRDRSRPLVALSEANRQGMCVSLEVEGKRVVRSEVVRTYLATDAVRVGDAAHECDFDALNGRLRHVGESSYDDARTEVISEYFAQRRARRDLQWYLRRMNLTSVGIVLNARRNARRQRAYVDARIDAIEARVTRA